MSIAGILFGIGVVLLTWWCYVNYKQVSDFEKAVKQHLQHHPYIYNERMMYDCYDAGITLAIKEYRN